ncbi:MAG: LysM peptidoglycan-binding domain-containing protein [Defluviitaleaceae bacterium]|nr:LysM peptidoglycan-binding domain-containing protein [Defluviitaleaceae bacterium]
MKREGEKNIIYDDAMSINAVGKLLGDKKSKGAGGFVKGFDTEEEPIGELRETTGEPTNGRAGSRMQTEESVKDIAKGRVRETVHRDREENGDISRFGRTTGRDSERFSDRSDRLDRSERSERNINSERAVGRMRAEPERSSGFANEAYEDIHTPRARSANSQSQELHRVNNEGERVPQRKISADPEEREQRKRRLMGMDLEAPKNAAASAERIPQTKVQPAQNQSKRTRSPQLQNNRPAADPFSRKRDAQFALIKIGALSGLVIALIVFVFLIWQINSLQSQLEETTIAYQETEEFEALRAEFEQQEMALLEARAEIDSLNAMLASLIDPEPIIDGNEYTNGDTPGAQTGGATVHTVQPGDSLSLIAQNLMGSGSAENVNAIMIANGLTNHNIAPGQQLTIPAAP